jgi:hypothetical protein
MMGYNAALAFHAKAVLTAACRPGVFPDTLLGTPARVGAPAGVTKIGERRREMSCMASMSDEVT